MKLRVLELVCGCIVFDMCSCLGLRLKTASSSSWGGNPTSLVLCCNCVYTTRWSTPRSWRDHVDHLHTGSYSLQEVLRYYAIITFLCQTMNNIIHEVCYGVGTEPGLQPVTKEHKSAKTERQGLWEGAALHQM